MDGTQFMHVSANNRYGYANPLTIKCIRNDHDFDLSVVLNEYLAFTHNRQASPFMIIDGENRHYRS